jgi:mono/diheme cytochrome c family protein
MNRTSAQFVAVLAGLALVVSAWTVASRAQNKEHKHTDRADPKHLHAPVPADYSKEAPPDQIWTDKPLIARGAAIYATKCAVGHGNDGGGDGPAVVGLIMKPHPSATRRWSLRCLPPTGSGASARGAP